MQIKIVRVETGLYCAQVWSGGDVVYTTDVYPTGAKARTVARNWMAVN